MTRFLLARIVSCLLLMTFVIVSFSNISIIRADSDTLDYPSIRANRIIEIEDGGEILINDTLTVFSNATQSVRSLNSLSIGFPIAYKDNLTYSFAYDAKGRMNTTRTVSGTNDLYLINVYFGEFIDVSQGKSYNFTVIQGLSGSFIEGKKSTYRFEFPLCPSMTNEAVSCDVKVLLPLGANYNSSSPSYANTTLNSRALLFTTIAPLEPNVKNSSWVNFTSSSFLLFTVDQMRREIKLGSWGDISAADLYLINGVGIDKLSISIPPNASSISVQDIFGAYPQSSFNVSNTRESTRLSVAVRGALQYQQQIELLVTYQLPFSEYASQTSWLDYMLNASMVRPDWTMKQVEVVVSFPEGGVFRSATSSLSREEGFTSETVKFKQDTVSRFDSLDLNIGYSYLFLQSSFWPTLWAGSGIALFGILFLAWKQPKQGAIITTTISPDVLRKFVELYDERRRLMADLESVEQRVQKGKVSRRQYKIRRSSLDGRLSKLQKDSAETKKIIESYGGRYADAMRRLEVSETRIETLNRDIERVESRYQRKELSAETRHRLLEDYNRGKQQAENTVDEIVLRLREELH